MLVIGRLVKFQVFYCKKNLELLKIYQGCSIGSLYSLRSLSFGRQVMDKPF